MEDLIINNIPPPGIPDSYFIRDKNIPMTKEEIRTLTITKARILPGSIVYDIGAGTGSISVEASLRASKGKVFSIEKNPAGIGIIQKNLEKFRIKNCKVIEGEAPGCLEGLPEAHRIIIGGSGGKIKEIISFCKGKLANNGILVLNSVTLKTLGNALESLQDQNPDVIQVLVSRLDGKTGILKGQNPVFIITVKINK